MSIFISPLTAKLLFVCTITAIVMITAFPPSSSLFVMAAIGDIAFEERDSTTIGAGPHEYSNLEYCVGLSTNNGNDAICRSSQKALIKTTLEPFAFGTTTTETGSDVFPLVLESEDLVCYMKPDLSEGAPFPMTAHYYSISTLAAKSTATKLLGTAGGYPSESDVFISSNYLLISDQKNQLFRCDLSDLTADCKIGTHGTSGLGTITADESATYAYVRNGGTKIQQFSINTGADVPSYEAEVALPNSVSTNRYLFYKKFSADNVEKLYCFDSGKLYVATITSGTMATPVTFEVDSYEIPWRTYAVAFVEETHLLVVSDEPSAVYSVDLATNRKVQSTNVACTGSEVGAYSLLYVSSTNKIHTFGGNEKCLYSFTATTPAPTIAPTPAPTLAPTPAPTPAPGGNNQQNNQDGTSLSDSEQEAVIGVTAAIGAIGVIAIVGMIVYTVFFKNKADENEKTEGEGNTNAPTDASNNNENTV